MIKSSRHHNTKEVADDIYDQHLEQLRQEGWIG
jgi:hypothetical protein